MSIIMSAITTAVAFFSISVDNFKGFVEMGPRRRHGRDVLSGGNDRGPASSPGGCSEDSIPRAMPNCIRPPWPAGVDAAEPMHPPFVEKFFQYPWWILAVGAVITTALVIPTVRNWERISFDYNLASLSAPGTESVVYEARMMKESDFTADTVSLICKDIKEAEVITRRVQALPSVKKIESLHSRFLNDATENRRSSPVSHRIWQAWFNTPPAPQPVSPKQLATVVERLAERLESYQEMALDGGQKALVKPIGNALAAAKKFQAVLQDGGPDVAARLGKFQDYFIGDLAKQLATVPRQPQEWPDHVGRPCRRIYATSLSARLARCRSWPTQRGEIWNRPALTKFLTECRSLGVPVTGPPVEYYEMTKLMREGFDKAAIYACVAVYLLLLVDFRRFKAATLTMVPDLLGTVWMVGLMGLCGLSFNPANLMVLPLIIGIGLANGVTSCTASAKSVMPISPTSSGTPASPSCSARSSPSSASAVSVSPTTSASPPSVRPSPSVLARVFSPASSSSPPCSSSFSGGSGRC